MKLGLKTEPIPLGVDENRPLRVAIMEIVGAEGAMDAAFNALMDAMFDAALAEIDLAEKALKGARAAIEQARAEKIDRASQN